MSNLVFFIDKSLSNNKFIFANDKSQPIFVADWYKQDTNFYKNFIVEPNEYKIYLPGPIRSVTLNTAKGEYNNTQDIAISIGR